MTEAISTSSVSADLISQYMLQLEQQAQQQLQQQQQEEAENTKERKEAENTVVPNSQPQSTVDPNVFMSYSLSQESVHLK
jgi:exoribonuclease R